MSDQFESLINQYLTFRLEQELYALEISAVKEVLEYTQITKVPRTQDFMRGVINVRGQAIPVVDLRLKFGLEAQKQTIDTCIIIVEMFIDQEKTTLGALVDGVEEVLEMDPGSIEAPPKLGSMIDTKFMKGIGKLEESFVVILDINAVFTFEEAMEVKEAV
jgi:purine-binding chemotaxis protein CheW